MKHKNFLKTFVCLGATVALVGCAGTRYSRSTGQYIDDKATAARVKAALAKDSLVKATDVQVESFRGDVHLTGYVDHPVQKERASQLTRNVKGVDWFKNDIIVKGQMPSGVPMQQFSGPQINESAGAQSSNFQQQQSSQQQSYSRQQSPRASGANSEWQRGAINVYDPAANITSQSTPDVQGNSGSAAASGAATGAAASANISSEPAGSSNDLSQRVSMQLQSDSAAQNVRAETSANGKVTLRGTVNSDQQKHEIENKVKGISGVNDVDNELDVRNQ